MSADCESAISIHADGDRIRAWVGAPDGSAWIADELVGGSPEQMAERLLSMGAASLLEHAPMSGRVCSWAPARVTPGS